MGCRHWVWTCGLMGMMSTEMMTGYVMRVLSTYLTDVWGLNFTQSAAIVNMWDGLYKLLPLPLVLISTCFPYPYAVPILGTVGYAIGLILMTLSTPPMLAHSTNTCTDYQSECIGHTQKALFYVGFPMVTIGMSSFFIILEMYFPFRNHDQELEDEEYAICHGDVEERACLGGICLSCAGLMNYIINIALSYIKPWSIRFGIPAICSVPSIVLFLVNRLWNRRIDNGNDKESPLKTVMRVFVASASKLRHRLVDETQIHDQIDDESSLPQTPQLRFLDKAAIILPNKSLEEQENNRWTLCTITDVEKTKLGIHLAFLLPSTIICGVVLSIGNTYFMEQANNLNPKIWIFQTSITYLLVFYDSTKKWTSGICSIFQYVSPKWGISVAMIFSVLCCITAAAVEGRRLNVIASHGLIDKPDKMIPMSMFWMLPQFALLAIVDSLLEENIEALICSQYGKSLTQPMYPKLFTRAIMGAGILCGTLSVHLAGMYSKHVGGTVNWFQATLNESRMDNYYWALAALSAANFVLFVTLSCCFGRKSRQEYEQVLLE